MGSLPGQAAPGAQQTWPSPASHLRSPARQARPPPEREARRCSLMARAGERSHHGDEAISPRPPGSGSRSLRRCSVAARRVAGACEDGGPGGQASPRGVRELTRHECTHTGPAAEFPFPRARLACHPHPDTCDRRPLPLAEAKSFLEEDRDPGAFPQSAHDSPGLQTAQRQGHRPPGPGAGGKGEAQPAGRPASMCSPPPGSCLAGPSPLCMRAWRWNSQGTPPPSPRQCLLGHEMSCARLGLA